MVSPVEQLNPEDERRPAKRAKFSSPLDAHHLSTPCQPRALPLQAQLHAHTRLQPRPDWKHAQPFSSRREQQPDEPTFGLSSHSMPIAAAPSADEPTNNLFWTDAAAEFDTNWPWPTSEQGVLPSATQFVAPQEGIETTDTLLSTFTLPPPHILASVGELGVPPSPIHAVPSTGVNHDIPLYQSDTVNLDHLLPVEGPAPTKQIPAGITTSVNPALGFNGQHSSFYGPHSNNHLIESPFRDCIGTFGLNRSQSFHRPVDGKVNGYIKFSWPKEHDKSRNSSVSTSQISPSSRITELDDTSEAQDTATSSASDCTAVISPRETSTSVRDTMPDFSIDFSAYVSQTADFSYNVSAIAGSTLPSIHHNSPVEVASLGAPRLIPSQYGYEAKMDKTDRRFWMFYIRNWCPGRSVLEDTNLWLKDFAQMHKSVGVRSAIQSLAGIYIYDYQPLDSIRERVNQRFADAEKRFTQLLNDPATYCDESLANELITIGVILSMQDIVLTERRLKKPFVPRWLQGFRRGEELLEATDHGLRFWRTSNVQTSALRISQSVIVGRAVILAQPMSPLPSPEEFNVEREASRFGWLLYGTERDMYQIHGGCGFSKKLLHTFSQVTYCAARLRQDAESPVVPMTADYIQQELLGMRQWSPESQDWEAVRTSRAMIEWVRQQPPGYKIDENPIMTDVTAEAWRIAAMLYLLCRVFRLPRNHPKIISNLDDLVQCIAIMPTSGMQFTAQAPLFPVFLLGILATLPEHRAMSQRWFDEVLRTPVRSSVPPLYATLKRIWEWIDIDFPLLLESSLEVAQPIHLRTAWWEELVHKVLDQENEFLCLT
ncbi:hypothetical protein E4U12_002864 [Claviceps purpurea]|nr:hypothetical protein E4U12_002864 [Claviceps purpurea]